MKKFITPLAAFASLFFVWSKWVYLDPNYPGNVMTFLYTFDKTEQSAIYLSSVLAIIALILILLSLFVKNTARIFAVVGLSFLAILLLLVFASFGGDPMTYPAQLPAPIKMAVGWYGSVICFLVALVGGFFSSQTVENDIVLTSQATN